MSKVEEKKVQNSKKKILKKSFFFSKNNLKILRYSFLPGGKNALLLVLPFEKISIQTELSSPPLFRIQGTQRDGRKNGNPCV